MDNWHDACTLVYAALSAKEKMQLDTEEDLDPLQVSRTDPFKIMIFEDAVSLGGTSVGMNNKKVSLVW